tara:strand:+ start:75937 stop:76626 length:690 start_codon:yes stop_codon:yes gene_type:complete
MTQLWDGNLLTNLRINGHTIKTTEDLAQCIIEESQKHIERLSLTDEDKRMDFQISCDGLNLWRLLKRLKEESSSFPIEEIKKKLLELICQKRNYEIDEFLSAIVATKDRPRSALGLGPLEEAFLRSQKSGFKLIVPGLIESKISNDIAAIAYELQKDLGRSNILLPIEQLRVILGRRKVVVSGTVKRLVDAGVVEMVNEKYHTKRAREFRFSGIKDTHYKVGQADEKYN